LPKPSKPLEKTLQRRVLDDLNKLQNTFKYKAQAMSLRGIPDIIICCNGCFIALELKRSETEKPTMLQEFTLKEINKSGGIGLLVNPKNWSEVYGSITAISRGEKHVQGELRSFANRAIPANAPKSSPVL
jgi:hypothetical protein